MTPTQKLIVEVDEGFLVGLVMTLTGGSANPAVVRAQIKRVRAEVEREIRGPES